MISQHTNSCYVSEGEQLLANKLLKKYGKTAIPFQTVISSTTETNASESRRKDILAATSRVPQHPKEWYELNEKELHSGCINFLSDSFDPVAALRRNKSKVEELNPFIRSVPMLDRVDQFRSYLPICDPMHKPKFNIENTMTDNQSSIAFSESKSQTTSAKSHSSLFRHVPICFVDTVKWHETGPYSLLYDALVNQQRIRILVRYVNSIRGTLTGYVTAFDQHMNLLLRDVDEQYSPRRITDKNSYCTSLHQNEECLSNGQAELQRRIGCVARARNSERQTTSDPQPQQDSKSTWTLRQRHMSQIMVRGDVVVLIYKACDERSAWSDDDSETPQPQYRPVVQPSAIPIRIGTPGSFTIPEEHRHRRNNNWNRKNRHDTGTNSQA